MTDSVAFHQNAEQYWRSAKEFVRVLIAELNQTLKQQQVRKHKRRAICHAFVFSIANHFDQQWMKVDGQTEYPLLCFAKAFPDLGVSLADIGPISCPYKTVELHAMVGDEIAWFFDEQREQDRAVVVGNVGAETPDTEPVEQEVQITEQPCWTCQGTGQCFCLRKGKGDSEHCPRCAGTGHCRHCRGTGHATHT